MSNSKSFCEKYPELCDKYAVSQKNSLGLPTRKRNTVPVLPVTRPVPVLPVNRPIPVLPVNRPIPVLPVNRPSRRVPVKRQKDSLGLPIRKKDFVVPENNAQIPESALIGLRELNETFKEFKRKGTFENIGLGTEKVNETIEQHKYSRLSDVAYKKGYNDTEGAEEIIANGDYIPDFQAFQIIEPLSTKDYTVLRNGNTGEVVMSFRGSDTKFTDVKTVIENPERLANIEDWWVNLHTVMGNPERTQRYINSTKAVKTVASSLAIDPADIVFTGHSNGGGNARRQAEIFGAKAVTFNAADNPFKDMSNPEGIAEGTEVQAYRTVGDIVSAGHERLTPEHMTVNRLNAKTGTETNLIEQHGVEQFYNDNPVVENGVIENVRTTRLRNVLGTVGGLASLAGKGTGALIGAEAFAPVYEDAGEEAKSQAFLVADTGKMLAFDGLLDPGATMLDVIDTMGMGLLPSEKEHIRHSLGLNPSGPPPKSKPPALISFLAKSTGRAAQDAQLQSDRDLASEMGLTLGQYLTASDGQGFTRDSSGPISKAGQESVDRFAESDRQQQQVASQDVDTATGFTRGGKTYVEDTN